MIIVQATLMEKLTAILWQNYVLFAQISLIVQEKNNVFRILFNFRQPIKKYLCE
jgi:hypothetical protein